jgi:hypothetical protein
VAVVVEIGGRDGDRAEAVSGRRRQTQERHALAPHRATLAVLTSAAVLARGATSAAMGGVASQVDATRRITLHALHLGAVTRGATGAGISADPCTPTRARAARKRARAAASCAGAVAALP